MSAAMPQIAQTSACVFPRTQLWRAGGQFLGVPYPAQMCAKSFLQVVHELIGAQSGRQAVS